MGRLQSSLANRNWDSIEELWNIKEQNKKDGGPVAEAFTRETASEIRGALESTPEGRAFLATEIESYQAVFGYKSMYAHEFSVQTWRERSEEHTAELQYLM